MILLLSYINNYCSIHMGFSCSENFVFFKLYFYCSEDLTKTSQIKFHIVNFTK